MSLRRWKRWSRCCVEQDTPLELITRLRPKVLVKGGDYRRDQVVGGEVVERDGGEVILVDLMPGHSTTASFADRRGRSKQLRRQPARPQPTLTKPVVPS